MRSIARIMCSAVLATFAAASLDTPPQLFPAGPSSFAHAYAHSVGEGDGGRRFARPYVYLRREATDDHTDRAVCALLPCRDRYATPELGTFYPPQLLQEMRLFTFSSFFPFPPTFPPTNQRDGWATRRVNGQNGG